VREVDPDWKSIPYGRPLANQTFHVLDDALGPRPVWVPGQLYIGGSGVARGYWDDESRTRESFVRDPQSGSSIYRTGDLGRYLPGGEIEFLGREDFQVKVQGFRIELAEVEHALLQHPGVRTGVVQLGGEPRGKRHLVAYVVPESPPGPPVDELWDFLKNKLPDYMVPAQFVTLPALPLTANGKVDRDALPSPAKAGAASRTRVEASSRVDRVGAVIREVMELDTLDPTANLLHLGATSIDMIRIANLLERELEFRPSMDAFYAEPTTNGLAALSVTLVPDRASAVEMPATSFIDDPLQRESFKKTQPGLRRDVERRDAVSLEPATFERRPFVERRSVRRFGLKPIPLGRLGELLSCLRQIEHDGQPKYRYGSAGALYPVQTYLYVKAGRVQDLAGGTYYHHPVEHRLVTLSSKVEIDPGVYDRLVNRPIFEESAFAVFFVAEMNAITPMYADHARHLSTVEAGLMTQLLEESGPPLGLGLCQIGSLEFDLIRHLFALQDSHVLLHSLLGGPIEQGDEEDESMRLLRRVQELSPDEAQALLDAHHEDGGDGS
jgi:SagB-type dehydrogenase family enzyme